MLDCDLLEKFIFGFFGYGSYDAKFWFVGMEERQGESKRGSDAERKAKFEKNIARRLSVWKGRGSRELEDLVDFGRATGGSKHFEEPVKLVRAWSRIIHVLLGIEGKPHKRADVKDYQRTRLARESESDSCLLELLPLPCPNVRNWPKIYKECGGVLDFLQSRHEYELYVRHTRINHLKDKLHGKRPPKAVVMYGKRNWEHYREIAGVEFHRTELDEVRISDNGKTLFILTRHVALRNVSNKDFSAIGKMIAEKIT